MDGGWLWLAVMRWNQRRGGRAGEALEAAIKAAAAAATSGDTSPVWTSQLVFPLLETGSESTARQQPPAQQEQFETGEKRWHEDFVVKLNYQQYLTYSVGVPAVEHVDVWARVGVGTRWLVAMEDAGCRRHGH